MRKILIIAALALMPTLANAQLKAPPSIQQIFQNIQNGNNDIKSRLDALNSKLPPLKTPQQVNSDIDQAVYALDQITVADLQTGIQVFKAMNNFTGSNCYQALLNVVQANLEADKVIVDANNAISPDAMMAKLPIKNVFTLLAKYYNLLIASQSGSELQSQCAAMKQTLTSNGPGSLIMGSSVMSKVLPFLKLIGIAG